MRGFTAAVVLFVLIHCACAQEWVTFRGNEQRTGHTDARSRIDPSSLALLWSYNTGGPVESSAAVADINGDGAMEIVFGSDDDNVYALDSQGGLVWNFKTGGNVRSSPTLADVNGDGKLEVLVGSDDKNLYLLDGAGRLVWNFSTGRAVRTSPAVDDLDGQGGKEIVFGSDDGRVYCLDTNGKKVWEYKTAEAIDSSPAIYDVDNDGQREVIIASGDNLVYALKHPPYKVWSYSTMNAVSATPAVDRTGQIVIGSQDRRVYWLKVQTVSEVSLGMEKTRNGWEEKKVSVTALVPVWNYTAAGPIGSSAAVGVISNETYGAFVGSNDKNVYFLSDNGTRMAAYTVNKPVESSPSIGDFRGDGKTDVVFGDNEGSVYVVEYPGTRLFKYKTGGAVKTSPALADLTRDGSLEVVVGSDDGSVYVFGSPGKLTISQGDALMAKAQEAYARGDFNATKEDVNKSVRYYSLANYTEGIAAAVRMLRMMDIDVSFDAAQSLLEGGNLSGAQSLITQVTEGYEGIGDNEGANKAGILKRRLDAEVYYLEAKELFDGGHFYNASAYSDAAKMLFMSANDTKGLEKVAQLVLAANESMIEKASSSSTLAQPALESPKTPPANEASGAHMPANQTENPVAEPVKWGYLVVAAAALAAFAWIGMTIKKRKAAGDTQRQDTPIPPDGETEKPDGI